MVICPRCQQQVDETIRTTCPICSTQVVPDATGAQSQSPTAPTGQAPGMPQPPQTYAPNPVAQPQYGAAPPQQYGSAPQQYGASPLNAPDLSQSQSPQQYQPVSGAPPAYGVPINAPMPAANQRLSLTGEVINVPAPIQSAPQPGSYGGMGGIGNPSMPRPAYQSSTRERTEQKSSGTGAIIAIVLVILLFVGGGIGGWYWLMHRTNPKDQAVAFYSALIKQDAKAMYPLIELSDETKKAAPNADSFAEQTTAGVQQYSQANPIVAQGLEMLKSISDIQAGEPVIDGDKAEVPVSSKMSIMGQQITMKGTAHMVNRMGIWKIDARTNSLTDMEKVGKDLLGKPDLSGYGGGMKLPGVGR